MFRIFRFILPLALLFALALPACAQTVLWEDENGVLMMGDDGRVTLMPPGTTPAPTPSGETPAPTAYLGEYFIEEDVPDDSPAAPAPSATPAPTAAPTATPVPAPTAALQYGDSGEHVRLAQQRLTDLGYYHGKLSGDFLEGTQSAARRFQRYNDLRETGKIDADTWNRMFSAAAIARDGSAPYATPSPVPTPTPFVYRRILRYGDSGELVSALQERLKALGFYTAKVSGGYYEVTRQAVRDFQAHNGLTSDGIAGEATQTALFADTARAVTDEPLAAPIVPEAQYTLMVDVANQIVRAYTYDENGEYTVLVREMICSTGTEKYATPLGTTIMPKKRARWGYFPTWGSHAQYLTRIDAANAFHSVLYSEPDERTLSVKSFEQLGTPASHGCVRLLVSDAKWIYDNCAEGTIITVYEGEYDPEYTMTLKPTLNTSTLRENPLPEPTPTPTYARENWPTEYRTLYRGREGEDVFMLQMRLTELGYYHGTVTGGYYGGTIAAVEAFQADHGLTVDGAAGKQTQSLLFSDAADPTPQPTPTPAPGETQPSAPTPEPTPAPQQMLMPLEDSVG